MKSYMDMLKEILEYGEWSNNRTGVRTKKLSGIMFKHDMREGFPLLTTKKINLKMIATELEFFIKGLTDKTWLQDRKCFIWNSWSYKDGRMLDYSKETQEIYQEKSNDLGMLYGYHWRNFNGDKKYNPANANIPYKKMEKSIDGIEYQSNNYGKFIIIDKKNTKECLIQFLGTGYITKTSMNNINSGHIKDPYFLKYYGVACIGESNYEDKYHNKLKSIWTNIIERCYNPNAKDYKQYGNKGVYVSNDWLIFSNFKEDVVKLPNWNLKKEYWDSYSLDKDINGGLCYSLENCIWLDIKSQTLNKNSDIIFDVITPTGKVIDNLTNLVSFCKIHNIDAGDANKRLNGKYKYKPKGWDFVNKRKPNYDKYKKNKGVDQLKAVVNKLKTDPNDRRMICSAWNPNALHQMALPPCHSLWQVLSNGKDLDLLWYQRSNDMFLGVPYNIASYALLLQLIAKNVQMKPRRLIGCLADAHIYENHQEQIALQLEREPRALPHVVLPEAVDIFTWKSDEFELTDYDPHPFIKAPIAI